MIDTSGGWWVGENSEDIDDYLKEYSEEDDIEIKQIRCSICGCDKLWVKTDQDECVIEVACPECKTKKKLFDSAEYWDDAEPEDCDCPICGKRTKFYLKSGFIRRNNGCIKWIYIGNMCTECRTLGSFMDWEIDYEPTDRIEKNV